MNASTKSSNEKWGFEIACCHCGCAASVSLEESSNDEEPAQLTRVACSNPSCDQPDQVGAQLSLQHKGVNASGL